MKRYKEQQLSENSDVMKEESPFCVALSGIQEVVKNLNFGNKTELINSIEKLFDKLKKYELPLRQNQMLFMELLSEIFKLFRIHQLDDSDIFGEGVNLFHEIGKLTSLEEMETWVKEYCMNIRLFIQKERKSSVAVLTENAKRYIEEHYGDHTLSVERLCDHLNISATHFSIIFKKEFGMSFISYLTKVRMEQAAALLEHTEDKSYIIAEKVGYTEANYFSYVFKKHYGESPKKYRTHLGK